MARPPNTRNARHIVEPIIERRKIAWNDIVANKRQSKFVNARKEVCAALKQAGWSFTMIGKYINRDHTTIIYAVKTFDPEK